MPGRPMSAFHPYRTRSSLECPGDPSRITDGVADSVAANVKLTFHLMRPLACSGLLGVTSGLQVGDCAIVRCSPRKFMKMRVRRYFRTRSERIPACILMPSTAF
jgi:hypothetical protein